jgi:hypothetical protein
MGTDSVPETMEGFNILTWLFARENFIERFTVGSQFRLHGGGGGGEQTVLALLREKVMEKATLTATTKFVTKRMG